MYTQHVVKISEKKIDLLKFYQHDSSFYPTLLESVSESSQLAQFDILFIDPQAKLSLDQDYKLSRESNSSITHTLTSNDFLNELDLWIESEHQAVSSLNNLSQLSTKKNTNYYPFKGGWFVFLAYEIANQIEPKLNLSHHTSSLPIATAQRFKSALILDHSKNEVVLVCEDQSDLLSLEKKILKDISLFEINKKNISFKNSLTEDLSEIFLNSVACIKKYIIEGDVFQVNLSRNWRLDVIGESFTSVSSTIYKALRKSNPAPFACLVNLNEHAIISSSPERLVKVDQDIVQSRPIAGTRPRDIDSNKDKFLQEQLHAHPKERSEHIMLIDLIRNDLGRVCQPGSIKVDELMVNESYQTVHHIVSNVVGKLVKNCMPGQILRAMFPGGTITGCPKVRCMEIIAEQEGSAREAYTGSVGYINHDGSMDFNILIRTMLLKPNNNKADTQVHNNKEFSLSFRAGAGLVNDSIAENEIKETRSKALGLLNAIKLLRTR